MNFEFDPTKSRTNLEKHGIDFIQTQAIWDDINMIEIPAKTSDEPRWLVIGKIQAKYWSAVITFRGENIRILSVRRSRDEEIDLYESI
jgi:uncharacterized DUF497 family protein